VDPDGPPPITTASYWARGISEPRRKTEDVSIGSLQMDGGLMMRSADHQFTGLSVWTAYV
jgi:hypothetical protein